MYLSHVRPYIKDMGIRVKRCGLSPKTEGLYQKHDLMGLWVLLASFYKNILW